MIFVTEVQTIYTIPLQQSSYVKNFLHKNSFC